MIVHGSTIYSFQVKRRELQKITNLLSLPGIDYTKTTLMRKITLNGPIQGVKSNLRKTERNLLVYLSLLDLI